MTDLRGVDYTMSALSIIIYKKPSLLRIKVRLPVLLCSVKTIEGDFRFCWMISPNVGQTHKENPNLVIIFIRHLY